LLNKQIYAGSVMWQWPISLLTSDCQADIVNNVDSADGMPMVFRSTGVGSLGKRVTRSEEGGMSSRAWWSGWTFFAAVMGTAVSSLRQDAGRDFTNSVGMKMIHVQAGSFTMGGDRGRDYWDERPSHLVNVSRPFFMSETEVTVDQYRQFRPDFEPDPRFGEYVSGVSWYEAVEFCQWLSRKEGKTYRLPTEAEWEYVYLSSASGTTPDPALSL
jgi:hypothetical protein